ncbi:uncharacterized protein LOC143581815 [Bidens hawaiensis]|uniref:uncharacterized protein LOC143581815 n=1 Tax=Bidens hawaiensis TaxID=980011 RepID=UPI00404B3830
MSDEQIMNLAKEDYHQEMKSSFKYEHLFPIAKDNPKWYHGVQVITKRTKTSASGDYTTSASNTDDTPISLDDFTLNMESPNSFPEYEELPRPTNHKKAKARMKAKAKEVKEKPEEQEIKLMQTLVGGKIEAMNSFNEKLDYIIYTNDMNVLKMPTAGMNKKALKVHLRQCETIRKKWDMPDDDDDE